MLKNDAHNANARAHRGMVASRVRAALLLGGQARAARALAHCNAQHRVPRPQEDVATATALGVTAVLSLGLPPAPPPPGLQSLLVSLEDCEEGELLAALPMAHTIYLIIYVLFFLFMC